MTPLPVLAALIAGQAATPQPDASTLQWEASVDTDAAYNFNHPVDHANFVPGSGTVAKRANELTLDLASVGVSLAPAPVGFHLLLGFGTAMNVLHQGETVSTNTGPEVWQFVQTASVTAAHGRFGLEAGIYPSHIGLESLQSQANWNYTHSWMGELSPYYQAGLKLSYQLTDRWSAQLHLLNGWQIIGDNNGAKAIGTQIAYASDRLSFAFNTFAGPELPNDDSDWRLFGDLVATLKATERLSFAASADAGLQQRPAADDAHWYAAALLARYQLTKAIALTARADTFRDLDDVVSGASQILVAGTGTLELRPVAHLILKLEARHDHSTAAVFSGRALADGSPEKLHDQTMVVLGAVATY